MATLLTAILGRLTLLSQWNVLLLVISRTTWSPAPFDGLALPSEQKDLVMAIAEARLAASSDNQFNEKERDKRTYHEFTVSDAASL